MQHVQFFTLPVGITVQSMYEHLHAELIWITLLQDFENPGTVFAMIIHPLPYKLEDSIMVATNKGISYGLPRWIAKIFSPLSILLWWL